MVSEIRTVLESTRNLSLNPCCCGRWSQRLQVSYLLSVPTQCLNPCCCGRWSQRLDPRSFISGAFNCLNPCCCGRWSQRTSFSSLTEQRQGLNPCCCGRWSQSVQEVSQDGGQTVLILVVVEDGLREIHRLDYRNVNVVLILVVVEDGLRDVSWQLDRKFKGEGLNPCCCGRWSQSLTLGQNGLFYDVLILVVVEDGLRGYQIRGDYHSGEGLNPCCCGRWSQRAKNAM